MAVSDKDSGINEHGIAHRRGLTCQPVNPIPDLRSGIDSPSMSPLNKQPFQGVQKFKNILLSAKKENWFFFSVLCL